MRVSRLSCEEAVEIAVQTMGLDAEAVDLLSSEGLCASLRRAASFLCPATPRQLVDVVMDALGPLYKGGTVTRDDLMDQLELLISVGDLLELQQGEQRATRQIFLGPPSYVEKSPGSYLLLGVRPQAAALVGDILATQIVYEGHTRAIAIAANTAAELLRAGGLHEIRRDHWLRHPAAQEASALIDGYRQRLLAARPAGQVEGLTLMDPSSPTRYYRGRWRDPRPSDSGEFVGRRPQAYGADLWCFVSVEAGLPQALIDLPAADPTAPGRDEAWRLQAGIDAQRGHHQVFRTRPVASADGSTLIDLFGPVPGWAERYFELVGLPVTRSTGSLFSYRVSSAALAGLTQFLTDMLWMRNSEAGGTA